MKGVDVIADAIGAPAKFLVDLRESDDWSFVIKSGVLVEATVGYVIKRAIQAKGFDDHVDRLNINGQTGKLQLVEALGLLPQDQIAYARRMTQIRNTVAHNLKNVNFTFPEYARSIPHGELSQVFNVLMHNDEASWDSIDELGVEWVGSILQEVAWIGLIMLMAHAYTVQRQAHIHVLQQELSKAWQGPAALGLADAPSRNPAAATANITAPS